ncbi:MAG TPA: iron ABC transporter permease [Actinomycetota bacterium]|nr:iron ABC transporter permease [Actinomycetota bacterium]
MARSGVAVPAPPGVVAPTPAQRAARPRRPGPVIGLAGLVVAALVLLTPGFLIFQAGQLGWAGLSHLLFRSLVAQLLWNTVRLAVAVTILAGGIGLGAAWCVERTRLPGRKFWAVVVVLPIAIPEFVVGYAWASVFRSLHGYLAAVLVMTLSLYPFVYLPVVAALRRLDPGQQEVAASLGMGAVTSFFRVTLRQLRPALIGGCLLVSLYLLADYGAFEIVRYQTFTTTIFTELNLGFDNAAASALALVLVALSMLFLVGEFAVVRRARYERVGGGAARQPRRVELGRAAWPVVAGFAVLAALGVGVPGGILVYWMVKGSSTTMPSASILSAAVHTVVYAGGAAVLTTALAIPVSVLAVRRRTRLGMLLDRVAHLAQGLPGVVIGLTLVFFALRYLPLLYQTSWLLVVAYALLFLPLALVAVRAALMNASQRVEEAGRSLGARPAKVFWRITLPAIAPGLAAGFALVFLTTATELTATLLLHPTGVETLATQFWSYTSNLAFGAAAPYALAMVLVAGIPTFLLSRRIGAVSGVVS